MPLLAQSHPCGADFEKPQLVPSLLGYFCLSVVRKRNHALTLAPLGQLASLAGPSRQLYLKNEA